jgi:ferredoxin
MSWRGFRRRLYSQDVCVRCRTHRDREVFISVGSRDRRRTTIRRIVQIAALAAFILLTVNDQAGWIPGIPEAVFARLDPLIGLALVVSATAWVGFSAAALLTVAATAALGRSWCGWICPVGTLLDVLPARTLSSTRRRSRAWRMGKYVVSAVVLGGAVLGWQRLMILDPITIANRPLTELLLPAMGADATGAIHLPPEAVTGVAILSLSPLLAVLALNALGRRTWCADLCPLGALLAVISAAPGIRRAVDPYACTSCGRCARSCPTGAIAPADSFASSPQECIMCTTCAQECPVDAIRFRPTARRAPSPSLGPSRRQLVLSAGSATLGVAVLTLAPSTASASGGAILRPPGTDEERLASLCVRCGACYTACPTGVLRPSLSLLSEAGMWTPMLDARPEHCSLKCNLCATPCPTGALRIPGRAEALALGLDDVADVDRSRCIAWARGRACMKCGQVCPIYHALSADGRRDPGDPRPSDIGLPRVDPEYCIGCDLCAQACPEYPPAIGVAVAKGYHG